MRPGSSVQPLAERSLQARSPSILRASSSARAHSQCTSQETDSCAAPRPAAGMVVHSQFSPVECPRRLSARRWQSCSRRWASTSPTTAWRVERPTRSRCAIADAVEQVRDLLARAVELDDELAWRSAASAPSRAAHHLGALDVDLQTSGADARFRRSTCRAHHAPAVAPWRCLASGAACSLRRFVSVQAPLEAPFLRNVAHPFRSVTAIGSSSHCGSRTGRVPLMWQIDGRGSKATTCRRPTRLRRGRLTNRCSRRRRDHVPRMSSRERRSPLVSVLERCGSALRRRSALAVRGHCPCSTGIGLRRAGAVQLTSERAGATVARQRSAEGNLRPRGDRALPGAAPVLETPFVVLLRSSPLQDLPGSRLDWFSGDAGRSPVGRSGIATRLDQIFIRCPADDHGHAQRAPGRAVGEPST